MAVELPNKELTPQMERDSVMMVVRRGREWAEKEEDGEKKKKEWLAAETPQR